MSDANSKLGMFIDLIKQNEELEAIVRAAAEANDAGKLAELARQHGIELSEDDFARPDMADLDEEELDAVAGGKMKECTSKTNQFWCGFFLGANKYI